MRGKRAQFERLAGGPALKKESRSWRQGRPGRRGARRAGEGEGRRRRRRGSSRRRRRSSTRSSCGWRAPRRESRNLKREIREGGERDEGADGGGREGTREEAGQLESSRRSAPRPARRRQTELRAGSESHREEIVEARGARRGSRGTKIGQYESVAKNRKVPGLRPRGEPGVLAEKSRGSPRRGRGAPPTSRRLRVSLQELEDALEKRRDYDALAVKAEGRPRAGKDYATRSRGRASGWPPSARPGGEQKKLADLAEMVRVLERRGRRAWRSSSGKIESAAEGAQGHEGQSGRPEERREELEGGRRRSTPRPLPARRSRRPRRMAPGSGRSGSRSSSSRRSSPSRGT